VFQVEQIGSSRDELARFAIVAVMTDLLDLKPGRKVFGDRHRLRLPGGVARANWRVRFYP